MNQMKWGNGKSMVQGEDEYAFERNYTEDDFDFAESGKVKKTAQATARHKVRDPGARREVEAGQRAHAKSQADFDQDDDIEPGRHKPAKRAAENPSTGRKRAM